MSATYIWMRRYPPRPRPYSSPRQNREEVLRSHLASLSEESCIDTYRLDKRGVCEVVGRIRNHPDIDRSTKSGLSSEAQLLVCLRYLATGNAIESLRDTAGLNLSNGAVYNCILCVTRALSDLASESITFPDDSSSITRIKRGFASNGGFPGVIGALGGTFIQIRAPSQNEEAYVSCYGGHAINVQVICDSDQRFLDAVVQWPASTSRSAIWQHCAVREKIEAIVGNCEPDCKSWLVGDSEYPQGNLVMTPILEEENLSPAQELYNSSHRRCMETVEGSLGVLKSRFRCLCRGSGSGIQYQEEVCCQIVSACLVLHNYCVDRHIPCQIDPHVARSIKRESVTSPPPSTPVGSGDRLREHVVASFK